MNEKELMLKGELYTCNDPELKKLCNKKWEAIQAFNNARWDENEKRCEIIRNLFEKTGNHFYITPPFYCDYGCNISIGENFYANADCIILDVNKVKIGNNVLFAPRVCVYTAAHPIDADIRNEGLEFGLEVTIGDNVWIGGSTVINPGVTIGNNVVIGSGSVVTRNIPDNVVAVGNPCRVLRPITDQDKLYWEEKKKQYLINKKV